MTTQIIALLCLFSLTSAAQAELLFSSKQGEVKITRTENPVSHFKHYVGTYIPTSISMNSLSAVPVVMFLHGGSALNRNDVPGLQIENGEFTHCIAERDPHCSIEYGKNQIEMYIYKNEDLDGIKAIAEKNQFIAILPGSNIGWTNESVPLFKELKQKAISELNVNPELFILAGHSMGAMGTIRTSGNLIADFKAFLAFSGTLNADEMSEAYVTSLLGTPLYIINEEEILYQSFLTQSAILKEYSDLLSEKYNIPSHLKIMFAHGNHNTVMNEIGDVLKSAIKNATHAQLDQKYIDSLRLSKNVYRPTRSHWIGNATCGKFLGTEKNFNIFNPSKYLYVKIQAESEGLMHEGTAEIADTYEPRLAKIENMTFKGGLNFEFVKNIPKSLDRMVASNGPYVCSLLVFDQSSAAFNSSDGFIFAAGQTISEAQKNVLKNYETIHQQAN